ncbi:MAG: hypothetical protein U0Q19_16295 [Kineosporiaceae bacterium]
MARTSRAAGVQGQLLAGLSGVVLATGLAAVSLAGLGQADRAAADSVARRPQASRAAPATPQPSRSTRAPATPLRMSPSPYQLAALSVDGRHVDIPDPRLWGMEFDGPFLMVDDGVNANSFVEVTTRGNRSFYRAGGSTLVGLVGPPDEVTAGLLQLCGSTSGISVTIGPDDLVHMAGNDVVATWQLLPYDRLDRAATDLRDH